MAVFGVTLRKDEDVGGGDGAGDEDEAVQLHPRQVIGAKEL